VNKTEVEIAEAVAAAAPIVIAPARSQFGVVIATNDNTKFRNCAELWAKGLSDLSAPSQIQCVEGAPSMATAYNFGMSKIDAEYVIFSHHDAFPLPFPNYTVGKALRHRMDELQIDLLGFAGSSRMVGSKWFAGGYAYGGVINLPTQAGQPIAYARWQAPAQTIAGMRALDGYCLVARKSALEKIGGFDEKQLRPSFHFYDLDIAARAFDAGLNVAVASNIYMVHQSAGGYGLQAWSDSVPAFMDKWAGKFDAMAQEVTVNYGSVLSGDIRLLVQYLDDVNAGLPEILTVRVRN